MLNHGQSLRPQLQGAWGQEVLGPDCAWGQHTLYGVIAHYAGGEMVVVAFENRQVKVVLEP